jgi:dethiobiotin synthetase
VRALFVTGTDTGAGKTILSAALVAAMAAAGELVRAHKPVVTGLEGPPGRWPPDHELLARLAGMDPREVAPLRYGPAVSPHLAASLAGETVEPDRIVATAEAAMRTVDTEGGVLVLEGVGGLLVPLTADFTVRDLATRLKLPVLIAAHPGLGTINHTLLTLHAARAAGLVVLAVVLTPWPERPSAMERSNRETIARLGQVEVEGLAEVASHDPARLARAGADLPWRQWLTRASTAAPHLDRGPT